MIDYTWTAIGLYMDSTWTLCGFYKDHTKTLQDIPSPYNLFIYFAFIQYNYYLSILYIHNNESGGPACLFGEWEKSRGAWYSRPSPHFCLFGEQEEGVQMDPSHPYRETEGVSHRHAV